MIKLDEKWAIHPDTYSWELRLEEMRDVTNTKTGKTKNKLCTNSWWYPTLKKCLLKYTDESLKDTKSVEEITERLTNIELATEKVRKIFLKNGQLIQTD
jgi:hypothetical protein